MSDSKSASSVGRKSNSGSVSKEKRCGCGLQMDPVTSWTDKNPGRRFISCPNQIDGCGFWKWYDDELCERAVKIIPGLVKKINALESKLKICEERMKKAEALAIEFQGKLETTESENVAIAVTLKNLAAETLALESKLKSLSSENKKTMIIRLIVAFVILGIVVAMLGVFTVSEHNVVTNLAIAWIKD